MQNNSEIVIYEFKKLIRKIVSTDFYRALQELYIPQRESVIRFQKNLPNWEKAGTAFTLFRRFLLKGDSTSIMNYGEHVQNLGNIQDYENFKSLEREFDKYLNYSLGFYLRNSSAVSERNEEKTFYEKEMTVKGVIDEMFYGGNGLFHSLYNQHGEMRRGAIQKPIKISGVTDENRLYEFFLALMIIICRIGMIIKLEEFKDEHFCKSFCPYRIYSGKRRYRDPVKCKALPTAPQIFRDKSLFS